MSRPNPHLDAALRYAAHGWPVFPLAAGEKVPLPGSHGLLEATTDERQVLRWFERHQDRNVAVSTGAPGPDVLDVDTKGARSNGFAAWHKAKAAGLTGRPQAIVRTPSGGMHALYRGTGQRNGALREHGLDFRGRGGYVVAVPSMVGGTRYEVVQAQRSADTCDWQAIRNLIEPQPERPVWQPREGGQDGVGHLPQWLAGVTANRNDSLFWACCRAAELGDDATLDALAETARQIGLTEREIRGTVQSALRTTHPKAPERKAAATAAPAAAPDAKQAQPENAEAARTTRRPTTAKENEDMGIFRRDNAQRDAEREAARFWREHEAEQERAAWEPPQEPAPRPQPQAQSTGIFHTGPGRLDVSGQVIGPGHTVVTPEGVTSTPGTPPPVRQRQAGGGGGGGAWHNDGIINRGDGQVTISGDTVMGCGQNVTRYPDREAG